MNQKTSARRGLPGLIALLLMTGSCQTTADRSPANIPDSASDAQKSLMHMAAALEEAATASRKISRSGSIGAVKVNADEAYRLVWGRASGLTTGLTKGLSKDLTDQTGAAQVHGWKTRWQTTYTRFDPAYAARYGSTPAAITDPQQLGVAGQGRALRREIIARFDPDSASALLTSLNNVIGWTRLDDGVTKAERQPRIDLTYRWDADKSFWQSNADTGWIFEVQAQALNILKTRYPDSRAGRKQAQQHTADLALLLAKCLTGQDINNDGTISPVEVEGGVQTALQQLSALRDKRDTPRKVMAGGER